MSRLQKYAIIPAAACTGINSSTHTPTHTHISPIISLSWDFHCFAWWHLIFRERRFQSAVLVYCLSLFTFQDQFVFIPHYDSGELLTVNQTDLSASEFADWWWRSAKWRRRSSLFFRRLSQLLTVWSWKRRLELSLCPAVGLHFRTFCSSVPETGARSQLITLTACVNKTNHDIMSSGGVYSPTCENR